MALGVCHVLLPSVVFNELSIIASLTLAQLSGLLSLKLHCHENAFGAGPAPLVVLLISSTGPTIKAITLGGRSLVPRLCNLQAASVLSRGPRSSQMLKRLSLAKSLGLRQARVVLAATPSLHPADWLHVDRGWPSMHGMDALASHDPLCIHPVDVVI
jgi:hypothetical protein